MFTNWDNVEYALLAVVKDNVRSLGEAMILEDKIKAIIGEMKNH